MASEKSFGLDEVFTVEKIIRKRKRRGRWEFFIKWKGYSSKHNTWEPDENIFDRGLIHAFETCSRRKRRRRYSKTYSEAEPESEPEPEPEPRLSPSPSRADQFGKGKPHRRHVVIAESSSSEYEGDKDPPRIPGISVVSSELRKETPPPKRSVENSDEEEIEIGRHDTGNLSRKKQSISSPSYSDHFDDAHGDNEGEGDSGEENTHRQPIRLTIRHSFCTLKESESASPMFVGANGPMPSVATKRRRKRSRKKKLPDEEDSDFDTSDTDTEKWCTKNNNNSRRIKSRRRRRIRPKVTVKPLPDPVAEPPELQVMVSDSELWFINERNTKHRQENASSATIVDGGETTEAPVTKDKMEVDECIVSGESTPAEKESDSRLDVVITDVKAHNYTVVIKECYKPVGFFRSAS